MTRWPAGYLSDHGFQVRGDQYGYVTSAESRTAWVGLDAHDFHRLFGTPLPTVNNPDSEGFTVWNGSLSCPMLALPIT
jgi:hypothetical protein